MISSPSNPSAWGVAVKTKRTTLALIALFVLVADSTTYSADLILNDVPIKLYFSPNGGCTQAIVDEINNAKSEILIQAYSFTSVPIAKAVLEANNTNVL
jgi:hypothetical protein